MTRDGCNWRNEMQFLEDLPKLQEAQMTNQPHPDPAAVRCAEQLENLRHRNIPVPVIIARKCGLEPGRALAEAVLRLSTHLNWSAEHELVKLANSYTDALNGKAG